MTIFFTSDLHISHTYVAVEKREFATVEEHDATIADNWASVVKKDDLIYVLGDLSLSKYREAIALIASLPGRKRLIWGNHDKGSPMYRDCYKFASLYRATFESTEAYGRIRVDGVSVLLSHFPYDGDGERPEDRYTQYRLRDEGTPLIHGHTHTHQQLTRSAHETLQIHVGVDAHKLTPVSIEWVSAAMKAAL